jgi:hypothetical protein
MGNREVCARHGLDTMRLVFMNKSVHNEVTISPSQGDLGLYGDRRDQVSQNQFGTGLFGD